MQPTIDRWTDQRTPALAIVARGNQIRKVKSGHYAVCSQSEPQRTYTIRLQGDRWTCECDHHKAAQRECIHILACKFQADMRAALADVQERPACDACGCPDVVSNGKRHNDSGAVTRWACKACGHKFTGRDGYHKRRADAHTIALALDLYFRGLSLRKVAEHLEQAQGLRVNPSTVYRWVTHYSALAAEWMDKQAPRTGERWHIDETVVNVNGEFRYLWNVMDSDTRFLLATHLSENRSMRNTLRPLRKAQTVTPDAPSEIRSDGMMAYPRAVHRLFGPGVHRRVPSIKAKDSNNRIERLHGTERERSKVMRAYDNDKGAAALAEGFRVHYNMVRKHQALGRTPAEAAGLLPIEGDLKWEAVLKEAARNRATERK